MVCFCFYVLATRRQWVEVVAESYEDGAYGWAVIYRSPGLLLVESERSETEQINSALYYSTLGAARNHHRSVFKQEHQT